MFGLVPFVSHNDLSKDFRNDDVFDRMMNVFDEPFFSGFRTPDFKVDVKDNGESYDLTAELPGMKKEDIQLTYKDNYLTIGAKNESSNDEKDSQGNYIRRERSTSSMSRSFYIDGVDESKATADYKDGVLSVHLPKMAVQAEPSHTIEIRSL
ncbi:Hsp20/alpha crystallin family protein [uncultured Selenomonas sp.]|uniref:Hsp20/alpha crystallin family protein n=1 Tax=uncultured Selenomonas sp. TaxID=159275 RepID=UPI0025FD0E62|nr:Hsp20/alpha crystallin family protein [uncultured Selenomonas sp.]